MQIDRVTANRAALTGIVLSCFTVVGVFQSARLSHTHSFLAETVQTSATQESAAFSRLAELPLSFEVNRGQSDGEVEYSARGVGYGLFLTKERAVLAMAPAPGSSPDAPVRSTPRTVGMRLAHSNPNPQIRGLEQLPGKLNYFLGSDPKSWRSGVETYRKARYAEVYPGIDLIYYGNQRELEYDFVLAPGADPQQIELVFEGVDRAQFGENGDLFLDTSDGVVRQKKPVAYQTIEGGRRQIDSQFVIRRQDAEGIEVVFRLGDYDTQKELTIDPVLVYSTFLGGDGSAAYSKDWGTGMGIDGAGNMYLCGYTFSLQFPTTSGSFDTTQNGGGYYDYGDAFVAKVNAAGNTLLYGTYLGGGRGDGAERLFVDEAGYAYVAGRTLGSNYPTTPGALQPTFNNPQFSTISDGFLTKLNPSGSTLVYSTNLGGNGEDAVRDLTVDSQGRAVVAGYTRSTNFPVSANGYIRTNGVDLQAFITTISADGSSVVYSSLFGGSAADQPFGVAVDAQDNLYIAGWTYSDDLPIKGALASTPRAGSSDAFIAKFDPLAPTSEDSLVFSARLGGDRDDRAHSIAVDGQGNVYVAGYTFSSNFPTVNGYRAKPWTPASNRDVFLTKYDPLVSSMLYSTYYGAGGDEYPNDMEVDAYGVACMVGVTSSVSGFPIVYPLQRSYAGGANDGFVARIDTKLTGKRSLIFSSYLGGRSTDDPNHLLLAKDRTIWVAGTTRSSDFPTASPFQSRLLGYQDGYICRIAERRLRRRSR